MNEATFEARVNAEMGRLFPSLTDLSLEHQTTFTLKLGHHTAHVEGKLREKVGGRADVLVRGEGCPLVMLELKAPGIPLTDADREQGLSYARLTTPMPPLVVLTNGEEDRFFKTHDGRPWEPGDEPAERLKSLLAGAATCAAADLDDAVRILLGDRPDVWGRLFRTETDRAFAALVGSIGDLTRPLPPDFFIERDASQEIVERLTRGARVVAVAGPPLCGKTNVLAQVCRTARGDLAPLYMDADAADCGLMQCLANVLSRGLFRATPVDQVRQWLAASLRTVDGVRPVLVFDGPADGEAAPAGLNEVLDLCDREDGPAVVLAVNEARLDRLLTRPGRGEATRLGRAAQVVRVHPLSVRELDGAVAALNRHGGTLAPGAEREGAYRRPRLLRVLAATFAADPRTDPDAGTLAVAPAVISFGEVEMSRRAVGGGVDLWEDYRVLAKAFLEDRPSRLREPSLALLTWETGAVTRETAEQIAGDARLDRLEAAGHLGRAFAPAGRTVRVPRVPELLAVAGACELRDRFLEQAAHDPVAAADDVADRAAEFPYGDIVGAAALAWSLKGNPQGGNAAFFRLLDRNPLRKPAQEGTLIGVQTPRGEVRVRLPPRDAGFFIRDPYPWLILSHLATQRFAVNDEPPGPLRPVLETVGRCPFPLLRPDEVNLTEGRGESVHDLPGGVSVLCGDRIVEPITAAMVAGFMLGSEAMLRLCRDAAAAGNLPLLVRLDTAARSLEPVSDKGLAGVAGEAARTTGPAIRIALDAAS